MLKITLLRPLAFGALNFCIIIVASYLLKLNFFPEYITVVFNFVLFELIDSEVDSKKMFFEKFRLLLAISCL